MDWILLTKSHSVEHLGLKMPVRFILNWIYVPDAISKASENS